MNEGLVAAGVALGLGLLIGFQRQRSATERFAGFRTFPLIALAGALAELLARDSGWPWLLPAALLSIAALIVIGSLTTRRGEDPDPGITTEVAAVVTFLIGALAASERLHLAVVSGGGVAVLLYFKRPLHGLARRMSEDEVRALIRMVIIALVILPLLPDQTYGPYDVLNPFDIWRMVVLIVGISMASYILYKLVDARAGTLLGGALGGLISSTATTASYARFARSDPRFDAAAAAAVMVASAVVFVRIFIEIGAVAPGILKDVAPPLLAMTALNLLICVAAFALTRRQPAGAPRQDDPSGLGIPLAAAALYAVIVFSVAAAKEQLGSAGLYGVALVSGLADVDAITLSVAHLVEAGRVGAETGWRAILLATLANLVFKAGLACLLGGASLARWLLPLFGSSLLGGVVILLLWP